MALSDAERDEIADILAEISISAGAIIIDIVERGYNTRVKPDGSPCTEADLAAQEHILAELADRLPAVPVLAEEMLAEDMDDLRARAPGAALSRFLLVDPLDGTRDFMGGSPEYSVNIALIDAGRPVAGVICAPGIGRLWVGGARARTGGLDEPASARRRITTRPIPPQGPVGLSSRRHGDVGSEAFLTLMKVTQRHQTASSIKFGLIAEGSADVYPRFGTTMEWDTAAGQAIVEAAGGVVVTLDGKPLTYGHRECGFRNEAFIAWGDPLQVGRHPQISRHPGVEQRDD